jgi:hypothetical protein
MSTAKARKTPEGIRGSAWRAERRDQKYNERLEARGELDVRIVFRLYSPADTHGSRKAWG